MTLNGKQEVKTTTSTGEENNFLLSNNHQRFTGQSNLTLRFTNVNYACKQGNPKPKTILNDACGEFKSGRLTAILGPSGAGKTSMLNVLSGFKAKGVRGSFVFNNEERNLMAFRKMSSYIPQDFAMLDLLTVEETLKVSTDLKLPSQTTEKEKLQIIDDILKILNMKQCRHTYTKNLSGGERKRLSIGIELVTNPPVMFFDEPTSGLDSVASLQLVNYLKHLAKVGRIIVCVVHQPSSKLMQLFDDVMVMSQGKVLYCGAQANLLEHFKNVGLNCPNFYNPADFVLEVASEEHNNTSGILELISRNKQQFCDSEKDDDTAAITININEHQDDDIETINNQNQTIVRPKEQVNFCRQFSVLCRRSLRSMSRNLISVQLRVLMHIVIGFLLGIVFWDIGEDASKALTNVSCIFFVIMFIFFGNAMPSILLCPQDTAVFLREYLNGWYSILAYYASKIVADLPMQFICPTFFTIIVYLMTGQPVEFERFAMCWGISFLTAFIGHFIGLVFGSTFDLQMSVFLVPGLTIPFLIFSGFFIRIHELSAFLKPLCDISFFRYTMEGYMQAIYGYGREKLNCSVVFCFFKSPEAFLKEMDMFGDNYVRDILALCIWILVLMILFYLSLRLRIRRTR